MKRSCFVGTVAVAMLASACAQRMTREVGGDVAMESGMAAGGAWGSEFRGMNGWDRIRASAFAQLKDNGTRVSLSIERAYAGSAYSWNVREGTCAAPGRVIGDAASYPTLFIADNERDGRVADIGVPLERGKPYIVNVYSSPTEQTTTIACGSLKA